MQQPYVLIRCSLHETAIESVSLTEQSRTKHVNYATFDSVTKYIE